MWRAEVAGRRRTRGQALIEFAFLAPVMMLLIVGMIDLGRGFFYQVEVTDAARNTARTLAGTVNTEGQAQDPDANSSTCNEVPSCDTDDSIGPGTPAGCNEAVRDLSGNGVTVDCPPAGVPATSHASVTFDCGASTDCQTPATSAQGCGMDATTQPNSNGTYPSCITVTVVYTFPLITGVIQNLAGSPTITLTDSAQMVSLW